MCTAGANCSRGPHGYPLLSGGRPVNLDPRRALELIFGQPIFVRIDRILAGLVVAARLDSGDAAVLAVFGDPDWGPVYSGYLGGRYDSTSHTQTVTVSGVGSDGPLFSDSLSGTNAGSYSKAWSFSNGNYKASAESGTSDIILLR